MNLPKRRFVDVNGVRISYRQGGHGDDLVFLHGLAGNARTWEFQFKAYTDRYRVTAWDAPGYGESDLIPADINAYGDLLNDFTTCVGIERFILLGHSMGGIVAGNLAGRYPARVIGLVLSCTLLGRDQVKGTPLGENYMARLKQIDELSPLEYGRARAKTMTAPGCDPEIIEHFASIAAETRRDGLVAAARVISEANNGPIFSNLNMPVLVIAGEVDKTVTKDLTESMIAAIPETAPTLEVNYLPGVAHAPYMEKPETYNAVLTNFLSSLKKSDPNGQ